MKKLTLTSILWIALSSVTVHAALSYLDWNGTDPGAGTQPIAGSLWGTQPAPLNDDMWSYSADGTGTTNTWVNGDIAVFSAGTDATNAFEVYVDGSYPPSVGGFVFEEGEVKISATYGSITMTNEFECPVICYTNGIINSDLSDAAGSGTCGIRKTGPGTLTLGGPASGYGGTNTVVEGILAVASQYALGSGLVPTVVSNGAAVQINIGNNVSEPLILNGFGVTNGGALYGMNGLGGQNGFVGGAVLESNSRINYYGTTGNWWSLQTANITTNGVDNYDLYLGGSGNFIRLNRDALIQIGDGALYKDGTVYIRIEAPCYAKEFHWNGGSCQARVAGNWLRHGTPAGYVIATNYVGAGAALWDQSWGTANWTAPWVLAAGASPVFKSVAGVTINFGAEVSGQGGLTKNNDAGAISLNVANTYTGNTVIRGGTLSVGASGSISNSAVIDVQTGATFNVSAVTGGFVLQAAQTLKGNGSVTGNLTANGTLSPGASVGTLTFNNDLTINGNLAIEVDKTNSPTADFITVVGTATNAGTGTLTVSNIGDTPLAINDSFQIFANPLPNGSALTVTGGGATWTNKLAIDGTIAVLAVSAQQVPATNLPITAGGANTFNLQGYGGASLSYNVFAYTNITAPMSSWWQIGTANANGSGVIQFTDTQATNSRRFYRFGQ